MQNAVLNRTLCEIAHTKTKSGSRLMFRCVILRFYVTLSLHPLFAVYILLNTIMLMVMITSSLTEIVCIHLLGRSRKCCNNDRKFG